jgi:mRNA-degrading endonuclease YafQ of YafQ-DinJ toxin-antitoxin module
LPNEWTIRRSQTFDEQLLNRQYRAIADQVEKKVDLLRQEPYHAANAERLRHEYVGLRSASVQGTTRIVYRICEECRAQHDEANRPLRCCLTGETPANTVNVLCLWENHRGKDIPDYGDFEE